MIGTLNLKYVEMIVAVGEQLSVPEKHRLFAKDISTSQTFKISIT